MAGSIIARINEKKMPCEIIVKKYTNKKSAHPQEELRHLPLSNNISSFLYILLYFLYISGPLFSFPFVLSPSPSPPPPPLLLCPFYTKTRTGRFTGRRSEKPSPVRCDWRCHLPIQTLTLLPRQTSYV